MCKTCSTCKNSKPINEFHASNRSPDGHRGQCKTCVKAYFGSEDFKSKRRNKLKTRYHSDPEYRKQIRDYAKQYRNTERGREYSRRQIANYLKEPAHKIKHRLRTRMYHILKGIRKTANTEALVGCSAECLKNYLESLFVSGMTWENYGKWHVDHKKPCASFNLTDPEQQKQCFHFTNLQPLWAEDNLSKSDKVIDIQTPSC